MGMTSILILAYMGSSMIVVLIFAASNYPLLSLLNKEEIVFEFLQSLIGSLGVLFTIPLTTIIASLLLSGGKGQAQELTSPVKPSKSLRVPVCCLFFKTDKFLPKLCICKKGI